MVLVNQAVATAARDLEDADKAFNDYIFENVTSPNPSAQVDGILAELQLAVEDAQERLTVAAAASNALKIVTGKRPCLTQGPDTLVHRCEELKAGVNAAGANLDNAKRELADLQNRADGTTSAKSQDALERQQLQARFEVAQAAFDEAQEDLAKLEQGADSLGRRGLESGVEVAGAALSSASKDLDDTKVDIEALAIARQREITAAGKLELKAAQAALEVSDPGGDAGELAEKRTRVAMAQANLTASEESLAAMESGADPLEIAALESKFRLLSEAFIDADRELNRLAGGPDPLDQAILESAGTTAQSMFLQAEIDLAALESGLDHLELALRERELELVQQVLVKAAKDLKRFEQGPDLLESALLETQISSAEAAAEEASEDLEGAVVRAPFSGVVSRVNVETDDVVTKKSRVIALVDPSRLEVHGLVDVSQIHLVRQGANAQIAIDSLPGTALKGVVTTVSASPRTERGVVTFPIVVRVDLPPGVKVQPQLSGASLTVTAGP